MSIWQIFRWKKSPSDRKDLSPPEEETEVQLVATPEPLPKRSQDIRKHEPTPYDNDPSVQEFFARNFDDTEGPER